MNASRTIAAIMLVVSTLPAIANEFYSGPVTKVTDGDTLTIRNDGHKVKVRLCGIDSPERGNAGYLEASKELGRITEGKQLRCVQVGGGTPCDGRSRATNRDRIVAQCFVDNTDIAMEMICAGAAKDWPKFSAGHYMACER